MATIDSVATTETLCANLTNLPIYVASVNGDIDLINSYFDVNYTQILARGSTVNDPIAKLYGAYLVVPDYNFKTYMAKKQDAYHDGELGASFTHEKLMAQATAKFTYLTTRKLWGSKFPNEEKLIAMITDLKGKLKLGPALEDKCKPGGGKKNDGKVGGPKTKNKKNTGLKTHQKKDEAWKKQPPRTANLPPRKLLARSTSGASITWPRASTPPLNAASAPHARLKVRGRTRRRRMTSPSRTSLSPTPPRLPPSLAAPALPPSSRSSPTMRNDGAGWHVHGGYFC